MWPSRDHVSFLFTVLLRPHCNTNLLYCNIEFPCLLISLLSGFDPYIGMDVVILKTWGCDGLTETQAGLKGSSGFPASRWPGLSCQIRGDGQQFVFALETNKKKGLPWRGVTEGWLFGWKQPTNAREAFWQVVLIAAAGSRGVTCWLRLRACFWGGCSRQPVPWIQEDSPALAPSSGQSGKS